MKNLNQQFRASLPQNDKKREDSHPDFLAKLSIWNTEYSAAAWLSNTSKNDLYIALRLTSESQVQAEKIKLAIWRNHERATAEDPHFLSTQEIFGRDFALQAWILPVGDDYRLEIDIKPASAALEVSAAAQNTKDRIAGFLAETGLPTLPPSQGATASLLAADNEPDDIPF
jgi:hypothetical protein